MNSLEIESILSSQPKLEERNSTALTPEQQEDLDKHKVGDGLSWNYMKLLSLHVVHFISGYIIDTGGSEITEWAIHEKPPRGISSVGIFC